MKKYIGCKLIEAEPMTRGDYNKYRGWTIPANENPADEGYLLRYPNGYVSWSPKDIFDKAYLAVDDNKDLPSGVSIGPKMVDEFIAFEETTTMGDRTTVVRCVLRNGFEIVESSSCVDPKNYSEKWAMIFAWRKSKIKYGSFWGFCFRPHGMVFSRR